MNVDGYERRGRPMKRWMDCLNMFQTVHPSHEREECEFGNDV